MQNAHTLAFPADWLHFSQTRDPQIMTSAAPMDSAFAATGEKAARFLKNSGINFTVMPDPKPEIRSATSISRAMPSSPASSSSSSSHASAPTSRKPSKRSAGGAHSANPTTATVRSAARDQSSPIHRKSINASAGPAVVASNVKPNFRAVAAARCAPGAVESAKSVSRAVLHTP